MANELSHGDPFIQFRDDINRLFQNLATVGFPLTRLRHQQQGGHIQTPLTDLYEDENGYRVIMEIPGFDPKDVEVNLSGNTLTVRAENHQQQQQQQQHQQESQNRNYYMIERNQSAAMRREIRFPDDIDANRINAEFRNGILAITVPRAQESQQRRRIEIKSG